MTERYLAIMQEALLLSTKMLGHAEQGQWEEVNSLEAKRNTLLSDHGELPLGDEARAASEVVQQIMQVNDQLLTLSKQQLSNYAKERGELSKGRRAVAAYGG